MRASLRSLADRRAWSFVALVVLGATFLASCNGPDASNTPAANTPRATTPEKFAEVYIEDVIPLADGGAYVRTSSTLWYVRGAEAVRVREVPKLAPSSTTATPLPARYSWVMYQRERRLRAKDKETAGEELEAAKEAAEPYDEGDYDDPY